MENAGLSSIISDVSEVSVNTVSKKIKNNDENDNYQDIIAEEVYNLYSIISNE